MHNKPQLQHTPPRGWEGYEILFLGRPWNEAISKKLNSSTSVHFTADIVSIRIAHKKLSGLRIPQAHSNNALKISNNVLYHNQMRLFRTRLKFSPQKYTKHNVRPTSRQLKQATNHATIKFNCWPKGTLPDFILMITNHMKLFGTNQV